MSFIVILIALLIERYFDWSHLRQWSWYTALERQVTQRLTGASPYVLLAAVLVPPILLVMLLQYVFSDLIFGFPWFVASLMIVLYCFGPKNLWADAYASINSVTSQPADKASETLRSTFNLNTANPLESIQQQLISQMIISANSRVFAIVFWYFIFGLPGALLYRLSAVSAQYSGVPAISATALKVQESLDWVSVRVLTFIFAIAGNFTRVLTCWRQRLSMGLDGNNLLITECGFAAITSDGEKIPEDGTLERSAVSLLDRAFIIVLIISFVLAFIRHA